MDRGYIQLQWIAVAFNWSLNLRGGLGAIFLLLISKMHFQFGFLIFYCDLSITKVLFYKGFSSHSNEETLSFLSFLSSLKSQVHKGAPIAETPIFTLTSVKSLLRMGLRGGFQVKINPSQVSIETSVKKPFLALAQQGFQTVLLTAHSRAELLKTKYETALQKL